MAHETAQARHAPGKERRLGIVAALTGGFMVAEAVGGWRDSGRILLEAAPAGQDARAIATDLAELEGVERVHHVHLWSISETRPMITLQARLTAGADPAAARRALRERLESRHGIGHATIEVENEPPGQTPPRTGAERHDIPDD